MIAILNDLHIGAKRVAGTTPETALKLRENLLQQLAGFLLTTEEDHLVINGDFFDTYNAPLVDVLESYWILSSWLEGVSGRQLTLLPGNHDLSKSSAEMGSFQLMSSLLASAKPNQVTYLQGDGWVEEGSGVYAISHVVNQAEFDLQLDRVPDYTRVLLLHCNYDSPFTEHSDHSLNLSRERAKAFIERGVQVILGHEHHHRSFFGGKVLIPGNQWPSSVADCVTPEGRICRHKHYVRIDDNGVVMLNETWRVDDIRGFSEIDWTVLEGENLRQMEEFKGFIRVSGQAEPEEAAEALKRISRLRQKSSAIVVANAVKVKTTGSNLQELAESVEDVRKTDVIQMVIDTLTPAQAEVVRQVWANRSV